VEGPDRGQASGTHGQRLADLLAAGDLEDGAVVGQEDSGLVAAEVGGLRAEARPQDGVPGIAGTLHGPVFCTPPDRSRIS